MNGSAHLWVIGYEDGDSAGQAQQVITSLAGSEQSLQLLGIAVLARLADGSCLFNGKPFPASDLVVHHGALGLLAGVALAVPLLSDEAAARAFDSPEPGVSDALGIDEKLKRDITLMLRPDTSALLVLGVAENMAAILTRLRGLGGTILKTNVNVELASLIQSTLAAK